MKRSTFVITILLALSLLLAACAPAAAPTAAPAAPAAAAPATAAPAAAPAAEAPKAVTFPRAETLYTGGKQWGPVSNWNPLMNGNYATGTIGLVYETLFLYDPMVDKFTPWLAESGKWNDATTYELKIRKGVTWSDGQPLTADDVKFTFELGQKTALNFSSLWTWLGSITKVDDNTLQFKFTSV